MERGKAIRLSEVFGFLAPTGSLNSGYAVRYCSPLRASHIRKRYTQSASGRLKEKHLNVRN